MWVRENSRAIGRALVVAAFIVAGAAVVHTAVRDWTPAFDDALIWLRTRDVGGAHTPLCGPYSRFGWLHPGPSMFYLLAIPLGVLRGRPSGLLVGALITSMISAACVTRCAARAGGAGAAGVLAVLMAAFCVRLGGLLLDPWNPYLTVLPFAAVLVAAWAAAEGDDRALLYGGTLGTLAMQSHVGTALPVIAVLATAVVLRLASRSERPRGWSRPAIAVLTVLWAPPLWEQFSRPRGNLSRVVEFFTMPGTEQVIGWGSGTGMAAGQIAFWGPWIRPIRLGFMHDLLPVPVWELPLVVAPLVLATWLAVRFRDGSVLRFVAIVGVAVVACGISHAFIRGPAFHYLTMWSWSIGLMMTAAPLVVLARRVLTRGKLPAAPEIASVATSILMMVITARAASAASPMADDKHRYSLFAPYAIGAVPRGTEVRLLHAGPGESFPSHEALAVALERAGRIPKMDPSMIGKVSEHRTIADDARAPTLVLARNTAVDLLRKLPAAQELHVEDPLSTTERATADAMRSPLLRALHDAGRDDLRSALQDAAPWLGVIPLPDIDRGQLDRYLSLAGGEEKAALGLFFFPSTTAGPLTRPIPSLDIEEFASVEPPNSANAPPSGRCSLDQVGSTPISGIPEVIRDEPMHLVGWAADDQTGLVPEIVVLELNGERRFYAHADRAGLRPDVAAAFHAPALARAGFALYARPTVVPPGVYAVFVLQTTDGARWSRCDTRRQLRVR